MKILEIKSDKKEPILTSYLKRNCQAWEKKGKLYLSISVGLDYFGNKQNLKSFLDHTADGELKLKEKNINLDQLSPIDLAEIIFKSEAEDCVVDFSKLKKVNEYCYTT